MQEDMYLEKIVNLVLEYRKKGKKIDKDYITKVVNLLIEEENLFGLIKNIAIYFDEYFMPKILRNATMSYNFTTKQIDINAILANDYEVPECLKGKIDKELYYYCFFNASIFHEIEHAKHYKMCSENQSDLETKLLSLSSKKVKYVESYYNASNKMQACLYYLLLQYNQLIYNNYYFYNLCERLAYLYAWQMSSKIAKMLENQSLEKYWNYRKYVIYTYHKTCKSPTLFYLKKVCSPMEIKSIEKEIAALDLPLEERLRLGLDITSEEYNRVLKKQMKIEKSIR